MKFDNLTLVLYYAERGWRVMPLHPGSKVPIKKGWVNAASTDESEITHWFTEYPDANVALVCGKKSNLLVLDVDCKHGQLGFESLAGC